MPDRIAPFSCVALNTLVKPRLPSRISGELSNPFDASIAFSTMMNSRGHSSGIVLFARDITDKLRADRELEAHRDNLERLVGERTVELENIRNSLAKIIEGSPVPTFVIDADHVITHWNKACEQISGVPAAIVSTGSERDHTIVRDKSIATNWLKK